MEGTLTILCVRGICARQQMQAVNTKDNLTMPVVSPQDQLTCLDQGKVVVIGATKKIKPAQLFFVWVQNMMKHHRPQLLEKQNCPTGDCVHRLSLVMSQLRQFTFT